MAVDQLFLKLKFNKTPKEIATAYKEWMFENTCDTYVDEEMLIAWLDENLGEFLYTEVVHEKDSIS